MTIRRGEGWETATIRVFWHTGQDNEPPATLVPQNGVVAVPAAVTSLAHTGKLTFEAVEGERILLSADLPYRVIATSGNYDGTAVEPESSAWQQFVQAVKDDADNTQAAAIAAQTAQASAEQSEGNALQSLRLAQERANAAFTAREGAEAAQVESIIQAANALASANRAAQSASSAAISATSAQESASAARNAREGIEAAQTACVTQAENALASATAAAQSESNTNASATSARANATDAQRSANGAAQCAGSAAASATSAQESATAAQIARQGAEMAQAESTAQAANALASANRAAQCVDAAATSASIAQESETAARTARAGAEAAQEAVAQAITDITNLKTDNKKQNREITLLKLAAQGKLYTEEIDSETAYTKSVPSGALPYASLDILGGKSTEWNQLYYLSGFPNSVTESGVGITIDGGTVNFNGTAAATTYKIVQVLPVPFVVGHLYYYTPNYNSNSYTFTTEDVFVGLRKGSVCSGFTASPPIFEATSDYTGFAIRIASGVTVDGLTATPRLFDLTRIFGAGNEPTDISDLRIVWLEQYAEAHPEYNGGSIIHADCQSVLSSSGRTYPLPYIEQDGWSIEDVYNERDFKRGKRTQRIGVIQDLSSLNWIDEGEYTSGQFRYMVDIHKKYDIAFQGKLMVRGYANIHSSWNTLPDMGVDCQNSKSSRILRIRNTKWNTPSKMMSALNGVPLYYELTEPVETDMEYPTDCNILEVEQGGSLTFENNAELAIPNQVTYQIKIAEAVSE